MCSRCERSGGCHQQAPADDALSTLDAAVDALAGTRMDNMTTGQRMAVLTALTSVTRRLAGVENTLIAGIARDAIPGELGGGLQGLLADVLRITPAEAGRRVHDAEDVGPQVALNGEPLEPRFPTTAARAASGKLDRDHVREMRRFFKKIPAHIDAEERSRAESFLADLATRVRPDELREAADQLATMMGHEDAFSDTDRARRRGFTWSHQDADGMSKGVLWATPALRAELDAVFGACAAPGKCNPDDETPCVDGDAEPERAERDTRSLDQRRHDALSAIARAMLASGGLGQHAGLPVTVIVSTTLQDIQSATGKAHTGGGTMLPMADLIRMATHANHYLAVFDKATEQPLWLGRSRRTASPGQRIVLHNRDRGCTFPGCTAPGYLTEVHHVTDWAQGGLTNIDNLGFACHLHHQYVTTGGWTTRKNTFGHIEWIPPPQLPLPGGANSFHHPERYLE